jgi:hypothetical protein
LRLAGQVVLGKVWAIDGRIRIGADDGDRPLIRVAPQHIRGSQTCGATAKDHDRGRMRGSTLRYDRRCGLHFFANDYGVAAPLYAPTGNRIERGSAYGFAAAEIK